MPFWSELFPLGYPLIQRLWFDEPGLFDVEAPADTVWVRALGNAAGGFKDNAVGGGGGSAFAQSGELCAPGAGFLVQVGSSEFCRSANNTVLGDTFVKRENGSTLIHVDRGRPNGTRGLAANSIGQIVLDGVDGTASSGGASAGDDADPRALGFGGRGATTYLSAWYGGGNYFASDPNYRQPPGYGRSCLEFWLVNPGYD